MTQNSIMNAVLTNPVFMGNSYKSTAGGLSTDDTFMSILSERIAARSEINGKSSPMQKAEPMQAKESLVKDDVNGVRNTDKGVTVKASESKVSGTEETKSAKKTEKVEDGQDGPKKEIEEEINTLEAMIALLEELMAKLEAISAQTGTDSVNTEMDEVLLSEDQTVSPMELLMALMEGNTEKLKEIVNELSNGTNDPEVIELVEKISSLIEKLSGSEEKDSLLQFVSELDKTKEPSNADFINDLKAKCGQLIEKLREQVSTLNDALSMEPEDQTSQLVATDVNSEELAISKDDIGEAKTQTDSKETDGKPLEQNHTQQVNQDSDNDFYKFAVQNNQITTETVKDTAATAKPTVILSGKPLEQTITNQVMMKVKLMAGENKQEMELHLKPESLGKLSLKIVHERGEILAKITAENEQVKGILESNMQLLRDALEKNGLSVQNLSVSVGNGQENGKPQEDFGKNTKSSVSGISREGVKSSTRDISELRARIEKEYFNQSSQINLTA